MSQNRTLKLSGVLRKISSMLVEPVIGYTRIVFATKYILSTIAVILMLALIFLPVLNPVHDNFRITFSKIENGEELSAPKMINPRFQGVDKDNQTYNIEAKSATKIENEMLILDTIDAYVELKNGTLVTLNSKKGVLKHKEQFLELSDSVYISANNGYEFYSDSIFVDMQKNIVYSNSKIRGLGTMGTIQADSFTSQDKGTLTVFKGNVKLVLYPDRLDKMQESEDTTTYEQKYPALPNQPNQAQPVSE